MQIVEEIADSGCSLKQAIDTLEQATKLACDIQAFMVERAEKTSLKEAIRQREAFVEKLRTSIGGGGSKRNPSLDECD